MLKYWLGSGVKLVWVVLSWVRYWCVLGCGVNVVVDWWIGLCVDCWCGLLGMVV